MRSVLLTTFLLLLATVVLAEVPQLSEHEWSDRVEKSDVPVLVMFYAPWCGHCKTLHGPFAEAAKALEGKAQLFQVDAIKENEIQMRFGIQAFPTLMIFEGEKEPVDYKGGRTAEEIEKYMLHYVGPDFTLCEDLECAEELAAKEDIVVLGFFDGVNDADEKIVFEKAAGEMKTTTLFGVVHSSEAADAFGVSSLPAIVVARNFDDGNRLFDEKWTVKDIKDFVADCLFELVTEMSQELFSKYVDRGKPIVWTFEKKFKFDETIPVLKKIAPQFRSLSFVYIDSSKWGGMMKQLGISHGNVPALSVDFEKKHYVFDVNGELEFNEENIVKFLSDYIDGVVPPTVRSQPVPEKNDGPVLTVVGTTFEELVLNSPKHVFIKVYAEWCGHCKALAPTWVELGENMKDKNVVIAELNGDLNEQPEQVKGFPTLMHYYSGEGEVYEGERELADLTKWVEGLIPEEIVPSAVVELFHPEFKRSVKTKRMNVVVFFTDSEDKCPHCKALSEKFDALSLEMERKDLVFTRIVGQPAGVKLNGIPSVMIWPVGSKNSPSTYQGTGEKEHIASWITEFLPKGKEEL